MNQQLIEEFVEVLELLIRAFVDESDFLSAECRQLNCLET